MFMGVQVKLPSQRQILIEVDDVLAPGACTLLHLLPQGQETAKMNKAGAYTLHQLQSVSTSTSQALKMVTLVSHPWFYESQNVSSLPIHSSLISITHFINLIKICRKQCHKLALGLLRLNTVVEAEFPPELTLGDLPEDQEELDGDATDFIGVSECEALEMLCAYYSSAGTNQDSMCPNLLKRVSYSDPQVKFKKKFQWHQFTTLSEGFK